LNSNQTEKSNKKTFLEAKYITSCILLKRRCFPTCPSCGILEDVFRPVTKGAQGGKAPRGKIFVLLEKGYSVCKL